MISFKTYVQTLYEGGNITGSRGETADPISTKDREKVVHDVGSSLVDLHNSFHAATGKHMYGKGAKAVQTGSAFSGSSSHLVNPKISNEELHEHKPSLGDIDTQVPKEHLADLHKHLTIGKKFGKYMVAGVKKHGNEVSVLAKHENGQHHQIDFEGVDYHNDEPTKGEQFAHNSAWEDVKHGIKGVSHKQLLNAAGGEHHKFSVTHGLVPRTDDKKAPAVHGTKVPKEISKTLFGHEHPVESFEDVAKGIKKHIHPSEHEAIVKKFAERGAPEATHRLRHILAGNVNESKQETHHAAVTLPMGTSPASHIGHQQLVDEMLRHAPPEHAHISLSDKSEYLSHKQRRDIMQQQSPKGVHVHVVHGAGESIRAAYDKLPAGKKVLHLVGGAERQPMLDGLKKYLEAGKVKEMEGHHFDEVHVHNPKVARRITSNGDKTSGTNFRKALAAGDEKTVKEHLGAAYTPKLSQHLQAGVKSGAIPINR